MELLGRQEVWNITYDHALGETASWFYTRIRDEGAIYGRRCAKTAACWCRRGRSRMRRAADNRMVKVAAGVHRGVHHGL